jgi:hypothetical protein
MKAPQHRHEREVHPQVLLQIAVFILLDVGKTSWLCCKFAQWPSRGVGIFYPFGYCCLLQKVKPRMHPTGHDTTQHSTLYLQKQGSGPACFALSKADRLAIEVYEIIKCI